ncbi:hypothetical protein M9H77_12257 [Catharanthus roseus]|uniref:Uncharacterized protein n=1 Tax=Catharanthus roseus TaxID=4058 RepID=A0ACC0BH28_CATRO|nr:hypothetical protein M9H77_12257 [Catharanthus roseus]
MARTKMRLLFIVNSSRRKATYKRRNNILLKKWNELSTLCRIQACGIIFGQDDIEPEVCPSILAEFNNLLEEQLTRKTINQRTFLKKIVYKFTSQLREQQIRNHKKDITVLMFDILWLEKQKLQFLNLQDLDNLDMKIEKKLKEVHEMLMVMEYVRLQGLEVVQPSLSKILITGFFQGINHGLLQFSFSFTFAIL